MDLKIKTELVFELVKDRQFYNAAEFKRNIMLEYGISEETAAELFIRVNNYQIKKYGNVLIKRTFNRRKVRGENGVYTFKEI